MSARLRHNKLVCSVSYMDFNEGEIRVCEVKGRGEICGNLSLTFDLISMGLGGESEF